MTPQQSMPPTLYHQLPIQHIHILPISISDKPGGHQGGLCYRLGPRVVERTRTMGVIVARHPSATLACGESELQTEKRSSIWLDDGTGVIEVVVRDEVPGALKVGYLVDVLGVITQDEFVGKASAPNPQASRRKILAENVLIADDPNMEALRMLESVALYKRCYFTKPDEPAPGNSAHRADNAAAVDEETVARVLAVIAQASQGVREEEIEATIAAGHACVQTTLERLQVDGSIYRAQDGAYYPL